MYKKLFQEKRKAPSGLADTTKVFSIPICILNVVYIDTHKKESHFCKGVGDIQYNRSYITTPGLVLSVQSLLFPYFVVIYWFYLFYT